MGVQRLRGTKVLESKQADGSRVDRLLCQVGRGELTIECQLVFKEEDLVDSYQNDDSEQGRICHLEDYIADRIVEQRGRETEHLYRTGANKASYTCWVGISRTVQADVFSFRLNTPHRSDIIATFPLKSVLSIVPLCRPDIFPSSSQSLA